MTGKSPWITEEITILCDHVGRLLKAEFRPHAERWAREGIVDRESWRKAGAAGLLCAAIPEKYGGGGGTGLHDIAILEEFHRNDVCDFAAGISVSSMIVPHYILQYGSEDQKQRWLPKIASGEIVAAIAMTEPNTGSDLQAIKTTAKRAADGSWVINGQKTFITNGQNAELILVVARTEGEGGAKGISLIAVETPLVTGFRRGRNLEKIGQHGQDTSELFFDDVVVPGENLIGATPGRGFVQLMQQLPWERLTVAVSSVVNAERAVELAVDYTKNRKAFGKAVFDFQNTQFKLAECKTKVVVGRMFLDRLIQMYVDGTLDADTAAMAKYWTSEMQCEVIDECLQLHGGYGYMIEYPIAKLWADTRVSRIYAGTNEIMKLIIARTL